MTARITQDEIQKQLEYCSELKEHFSYLDRPLAMVDTYGCQQNEADSEKIRGIS